MIQKNIVKFGTPAVVACDANCSKAWGVVKRPRIELDPGDCDDIAYLADSELGDAPADPGTYEGFDAKPQAPEERLNKWCSRQCERSVIVAPNQIPTLKDFSGRIFNQPFKHK
jgi:hypothetical protein